MLNMIVLMRERKGETFQAYDEFHTFKRMHIRTSMKSSLKYSFRPSVTLKSQTRQKFLEKDVILKPNRLFGDGLEMIATSRNIDRREGLKHPLGPLH